MNRIAELRKSRGISQSQLAKEICVAQNTLSQYENEIRKPTGRALLALAAFFDVSTQYILGIPEEKAQNGSNVEQLCLSDVTQIKVVYTEDDVNNLLRLGWKLLHIGQDSTPYDDGKVSAAVLFTLGQFGKPVNELPFVADADNLAAASIENLEEW